VQTIHAVRTVPFKIWITVILGLVAGTIEKFSITQHLAFKPRLQDVFTLHQQVKIKKPMTSGCAALQFHLIVWTPAAQELLLLLLLLLMHWSPSAPRPVAPFPPQQSTQPSTHLAVFLQCLHKYSHQLLLLLSQEPSIQGRGTGGCCAL